MIHSGKRVLILLSGRRSNDVQSLSIGKQIAKNGTFYTRHIVFNSLIYLPGIFFKIFPIWLAINKNDGFSDIDDCDIIVSCGSRMVLYAQHLRKTRFKNAKIVQILKPNFISKDVDIVLLPEHDKKPLFNAKKVLNYKGSMTSCLLEDIEKIIESEEAEEGINKNFLKVLRSMSRPIIAVYIGGNSKHFKFNSALVEEFARRVNFISKNMNASLLITTSRRTTKKIAKIFKNSLDCNYYFYDQNESKSPNPYLLYLKHADYHIVTGDSISMISEVVSTKKPVYLFVEGIKSRKYNFFHNSIFINHIARELTRDLIHLESYSPKEINNMQELADKILTILYS